MDENFLKRGYNFSQELLDAWEEFHKPSKDYSPSAAGAFLVWMALEPELREQARRMASEPNIKKSIREFRQLLTQSVVEKKKAQILDKLSPAQLELLVKTAEETTKRLARKK